jgi:tetratricopeptide (TPR) repeat protein
MPRKRTAYRVFIASPGGLEVERKAFSDVIQEFNLCARDRRVDFDPVGWEIALPGMGRPQALINEDVQSCDYFFMVLHDRWGQPTDAGPSPKYKSGTHEEYCTALESYHDNTRPMRQLVILFKAVDPSKLADAGPQLQQVIDFRKELEREKKILFSTFDEIKRFETLVRQQLHQWLFEHERGLSKKKVGAQSPPPISLKPSATPLPSGAKGVTSGSYVLIDEAEHLASEGRLVEAETKFAEAIVAGNDAVALNRYGHFLVRVGRLDQASVMYQRVLQLGDLSNEDLWRSVGYGSLGVIYQTRGELGRAEEMHKKSLVISERIGRQEGMANQYGNLGVIHQMRGELDRAEEMHKKSLAINEQLGRKEGMADQYGDLGLVYRKRGELDRAEEMHQKSLAIEKQLGRKEGIASDYGNLGLIFQLRGEFDRAEEMHKKSLALNEQLGRKEGMAVTYGNLGIIYGKLGDMDRAEDMLKKSLSIDEQLGRKEGMANQYVNLGNVYAKRGDKAKAREHWKRSRELFAEIGMPHMVQMAQRSIDELPDVLKEGNS